MGVPVILDRRLLFVAGLSSWTSSTCFAALSSFEISNEVERCSLKGAPNPGVAKLFAAVDVLGCVEAALSAPPSSVFCAAWAAALGWPLSSSSILVGLTSLGPSLAVTYEALVDFRLGLGRVADLKRVLLPGWEPEPEPDALRPFACCVELSGRPDVPSPSDA